MFQQVPNTPAYYIKSNYYINELIFEISFSNKLER